jgi:hypothetical protein
MQQSVDTNTPEGGGCRREVLASTQELDATNATAMDVRSQFVYRYNLSNAASTYTHMAVSQPRRGFPNPESAFWFPAAPVQTIARPQAARG